MISYEFLKEIYFQGHLSPWESHTITIIVTAIFSTLAAFLTIRLANGLVKESQKAHLKLTSINKNIFDALILINERGIIKTINPATEKMFGYSGNELVGTNIKIWLYVNRSG